MTATPHKWDSSSEVCTRCGATQEDVEDGLADPNFCWPKLTPSKKETEDENA